jgi:hypothetical protein
VPASYRNQPKPGREELPGTVSFIGSDIAKLSLVMRVYRGLLALLRVCSRGAPCNPKRGGPVPCSWLPYLLAGQVLPLSWGATPTESGKPGAPASCRG